MYSIIEGCFFYCNTSLNSSATYDTPLIKVPDQEILLRLLSKLTPFFNSKKGTIMDKYLVTKVDRCERWLLNLLKQGPKRPAEIVELASTFMGFSRTTVFRARRMLGDQIQNTQGHKSPDNQWKLADD